MNWSKRISVMAVATAIGAASIVAPAGAAKTKPTHWTKTHCTSYVKKWDKAHKHATKAQKAKADKLLKKHGCTNKVK
ncbi:MAG TPA: hypothetical protein VF032_02340 [Thermoleophilaceae bacterium]